MSTRLADRAARYLERRLGRRGFLARSALAGSALVAAPSQYVLRPGSAYAAICSCNGSSCDCGSLCCDGYTEFCCTIYGANRCPPGTLTGGWWKVDGSGYCGGSARYYLDCHPQCGSCGCGGNGICSGTCTGTRCGCANGSCANRKSGCTRFRYGQCNQDRPCLGPILCRVVTCSPPWTWDPACGTSPRTDNATRNHHRPCLEAPPPPVDPEGAIRSVEVLPGAIRVQGWVADPETSNPIRARIYVDGDFKTSVVADLTTSGLPTSVRGSRHGFDVTVRSTTGTKLVCLEAVNVGRGETKLVDTQEVVIPSTPVGVVDVVHARPGAIVVRGWALDPDTTAPIGVRVNRNGNPSVVVTADRHREDVAQRFPWMGPQHGFDITIAPLPSGQHEICVYAGDPPTGPARLLACRTVTVPGGPPVGELEQVTAGSGSVRVVGWALDPDVDDPIDVRVLVDGVEAATGTADRGRADVRRRWPHHGARHGFDLTVAAAAGQREICVEAVDAGGTPLVQLGCADVVVA